MSSGDVVGTIVDKERKSEVQWIISPDHFSRTWQENEYLQSPPFHFLRSSWHLRFFPNERGSLISLVRDDITNKKFPLTLSVRFHIYYKHYIIEDDEPLLYTFYKYYKTCKREWDEFDFDDFAENLCFPPPKRVITNTKIKCFVAEEHPQTMDMSSFCARQFSNDFENLFMSRQRSDIRIVTKGMTFPVHKLILKARCPMFYSMFTHPMKENKEGVLNFKGYNGRTMYHFLTFLYTGKLKSCDSYSSAKCLYKMADLYLIEDLKIRSRQLIEQKMCEDTVCDILNLAQLLKDSQLMESAKRFTKNNFHRIFYMKRWGKFRIENESLAKSILDEFFLAKEILKSEKFP